MEQVAIDVDAKKALEIIEPIPAEDFITTLYANSERTKCCVLGHIQKALSGDPYRDGNGFGIRERSRKFLRENHGTKHADIAYVNNDNNINGYNELIIKDRVVHLLKDMVEAGY